MADSSSPHPLTQSQRQRVSLAKWTAIVVDDPCAVLVECGKELTFFLAKQQKKTLSGHWFGGVHLISIPNGIALRFLELKAMVTQAYLPDEWLFEESTFSQSGMEFDGVKRPNSDANCHPLRQLTEGEHWRLTNMRGRDLRERVVAMFREFLPRHVVQHRPWDWPKRKVLAHQEI